MIRSEASDGSHVVSMACKISSSNPCKKEGVGRLNLEDRYRFRDAEARTPVAASLAFFSGNCFVEFFSSFGLLFFF